MTLTAAAAAYSVHHPRPIAFGEWDITYFADFESALQFFEAGASVDGEGRTSSWINGRKPGRKTLGPFREQEVEWAAYQQAIVDKAAAYRTAHAEPEQSEWSHTLQEAGEIYATRRAARQNA